eukprot:TRINITY_DN46191_c0_g1_i1.p1 TRINITY_DN46191_c0_g1~~TRINITY_DN46191_c0_g1_i1.p1  ORF type:complete len:493 (+),score=90.71 TRINITY_DN46191_c0_g1_i1:16-1494(+)
MAQIQPLGLGEEEEKFTRWSTQRYVQDKNTPHYVPWQMFTAAKGEAMRVFLHRTLLNDMNRMSDEKNFDDYFGRKRGRSPEPTYNAKGERQNTRENRFRAKKKKIVDELLQMSNLHHGRQVQMAQTKYTKKVFFSKEFLDQTSFRIIIGPRGRTQQELEQQTGARITVLGKGTQSTFGRTPRQGDDDDPHILIQAPTEEILRKAVSKIEWILGDSEEAQQWKQQKLKELAIINGTFRDLPDFGGMGTGAGINDDLFAKSKANQNDSADGTGDCDEEYGQFMKELLEDEDTKDVAEKKEAPTAPTAPPAPKGVPTPSIIGAPTPGRGPPRGRGGTAGTFTPTGPPPGFKGNAPPMPTPPGAAQQQRPPPNNPPPQPGRGGGRRGGRGRPGFGFPPAAPVRGFPPPGMNPYDMAPGMTPTPPAGPPGFAGGGLPNPSAGLHVPPPPPGFGMPGAMPGMPPFGGAMPPPPPGFGAPPAAGGGWGTAYNQGGQGFY